MSLQKTKKLRDKLLLSSGIKSLDLNTHTKSSNDSLTEEDAVDDDELLLEMLGGTASNAEANAKNQQATRKKKWGKKGKGEYQKYTNGKWQNIQR